MEEAQSKTNLAHCFLGNLSIGSSLSSSDIDPKCPLCQIPPLSTSTSYAPPPHLTNIERGLLYEKETAKKESQKNSC